MNLVLFCVFGLSLRSPGTLFMAPPWTWQPFIPGFNPCEFNAAHFDKIALCRAVFHKNADVAWIADPAKQIPELSPNGPISERGIQK